MPTSRSAYEERDWSLERHRQPGPAPAGRAGGRDHALERAVHALDLEDRAGARRGLHRRPEARRVVAALGLAARRPRRRRPACPPGVLNVAPGDRRGGRRRAGRAPAACAAISLTGSPETGRVDRRRPPPRNLVPFTAELGGKGPLIVFADADLEAAARKAAGQYDDAGQVCLAGTRLLVEESGRRRVPRALFDRVCRRARARRPARRRDDRLAADPPRAPRSGRRLRRARSGGGRRDRPRRRPRRARRALVRADARPAPLERQRDRAARGVRPGAHPADVRGRGRGDRARQLDALRPLGDRLHGLDGSAPSGSAARSAPGPCGSTRSSSAT